MNQILAVENKKKKSKKNKSSSQIEIKNIVMFFAVVIVVFGTFLIGQGSYAIYQESKGKNKEDLPNVKVSRVNDTIILDVTSKHVIEKLKYSWNNSEETVIPVEDTHVEEEITLLIESSILNIIVEDETGRAIKYRKEFNLEGIDITKPKIDIKPEDNQGNIKIIAEDETEISYITYKVNDEDEIRIDKTETEEKSIVYILKLERGQNKVIVTAVDKTGNIEIKEKEVVVSEAPEIQLIQNAKTLTVVVKDTDGIKDLEINLNGKIYTGSDINQKEVRLPVQLENGVNTIKIKVTNVNGLVAEGAREVNYAD